MKKSTKLITTSIALMLVVTAMVVGIYAATSGSASITANVSWEAEAGLQFSISGGVAFSKAHYEANGNKLPDSDYNSILTQLPNQQKMETISVNTSITNSEASGFSRTLNADFCDDTDDGVNNPRSIIYWYSIANNTFDFETRIEIVPYTVTITKIPKTTSEIKVQYAMCAANAVDENDMTDPLTFTDTVPTIMHTQSSSVVPPMIAIKLTLINPDQSLTGFDAGINFKFEKA